MKINILVIVALLIAAVGVVKANKHMSLHKPTTEQRCDLLGGIFYPKGPYCILRMVK